MKKKTRKTDIIIVIVIVLLIAAGIILSVIGNSGSKKTDDVHISVFYTDYNGRTIGILTGSSFEQPTLEYFPDSKYRYFDNISDLVMALSKGMIDGFVEDEPLLRMIKAEHSDIGYFHDYLNDDDYSFAFQKNGKDGGKIREQFDEMLTELEKNGTLDDIRDKWFTADPDNIVIDRSGLTGENGKLNVGINTSSIPFGMVIDGEPSGYAAELITMFCREYGYNPQFDTMTFSAIIPSISSERYDMAAANISVTPERSESVYFSNKESESKTVLITKASAAAVDPQNTKTENRPFSYYADNKKIGVITGGLYEVMIKERYPNADLNQYNNQADLGAALNAGIIDCFTVPRSTAEDFKKQ